MAITTFAIQLSPQVQFVIEQIFEICKRSSKHYKNFIVSNGNKCAVTKHKSKRKWLTWKTEAQPLIDYYLGIKHSNIKSNSL